MPEDFTMESPNHDDSASSGNPPLIPADAEQAGSDPSSDGPPPSPMSGMNELWSIDDDDSPAPQAKPAAETTPTTTPQPKPEAKPEGPDPAMLLAKMEESNKRVEQLEQRLRDTQSWGNQANMTAQVAAALVQAEQQKKLYEQQYAAWQKQQEFPQIDGEAALADPEQYAATVRKSAEWARDGVLGMLSPQIAGLQAQLQQYELARPLIEKVARSEARDLIMKDKGLDAEQVEKVLDQAFEIINEERDAWAYKLKPDAIAYAAAIALQKNGAPIKSKPKPTPSAGKGDAAPKPARSPLSGEALRQAKMIEQMFNIQFDDADQEKLALMNARGR